MADDSSKYAFRFDENDFGEMKATTWRPRFQDAMLKLLHNSTGKTFESWFVRAGIPRVVFSNVFEKNNFPFYREPLLFFSSGRHEPDTCTYGLWLMRPGKTGEWSDRYASAWGWDSLMKRLKDTEIRAWFIELLSSGGFEISVDEMHYGNHIYYYFTPSGSALSREEVKTGTVVEVTWDEFFEYLEGIPDRVTTRVDIFKSQRIGEDLSIDLEPVKQTLASLEPLLNKEIAVGEITLIGALSTKRPRTDVEPTHQFLEQHGKVTNWWSYPLKPQYEQQLRQALPFDFYMYHRKDLFVRYRVVDFRTQPGKKGIVSPWPEYTIEEEVDKTRLGDTDSQIFKTWLLIDEIEELDEPLRLNDFEEYSDGSELVPQTLVTTFIYAKRREASPVAEDELNPIYRYFGKMGFHFPHEVITDYYLALKTKPFVILSGISGTGKTKIAQVFAEYMCPEETEETVELPENTDTTFYKRIQPDHLKRGRQYVTVDILDYFDVPEKGNRRDLKLEFDNQQEAARLNNIGWKDPTMQQAVYVFFKQKAKTWIRQNFELGDIIKYTVMDEETRTHYRVEKYSAPKVTKKAEKRWAFLSVRPDWTDNRGPLGFYDLLNEVYRPTKLLKIMLRAKNDPERRPYFVILDEMNLAKVEYYFSDFLSCIESRIAAADGTIQQEPIRLHDQPGDIEFEDVDHTVYIIPPTLEIPTNLYFTGTVNIDETTYMFSPKVLDRANTIEFNAVELDSYGSGEPARQGAKFVIDKDIDVHEAFGRFELAGQKHYQGLSKDAKTYVSDINDILDDYHLHFGYRVANEIALYLKNAVELVEAGQVIDALDFQILQKVLPRFHGSRQKLQEPLGRLLAFCFGDELEDSDYKTITERYGGRLNKATFKRTAKKLMRMLRILADQGFVSFVE